MENTQVIEAKMTNLTFAVGDLFDRLYREDPDSALKIIARLIDYLNDKPLVEIKRIELKKDYDRGFISKEEYEKLLTWL